MLETRTESCISGGPVIAKKLALVFPVVDFHQKNKPVIHIVESPEFKIYTVNPI